MIVVLLAVGLLPLWYVALVSGSPGTTPSLGTGAAPVAVNASTHTFAPTAGFLNGLTEVGTAQSGVLIWIALFVLVGALVLAFRFVDHLGGRSGTDVGESKVDRVSVPSFLVGENRRILEYVTPSESRGGLAAVGALTWASVTLTCLLVWEGVTLARTQFLGLYFGGLLFTLALLVMTYAAYFVPHITVVETREHGAEVES